MIAAPAPPKPAIWRPLAFSVPKDGGQRNEDSWQFSRKGVAALSDGASVSFDSASWARILVRRYARDPRFAADWLAAALAEFGKLHRREELPWMQQAAFDRGSFASLLGVERRGDRISILAVGDSLAVLCDGDRMVATYPYETPEQFDERPRLISTNPAENTFLAGDDPLGRFAIEWDVGPLTRPGLICATDALGHWIMVHRNERQHSPIAALRGLGSRRQFARFVAAERAAGRLRRDDTTMLAYWDFEP